LLENYKTIKELADELNISKQALQKRINQLPDNLKPTKVGGKFLINVDLQKYFYDVFGIKQRKDNLVVDFDNRLSAVVNSLKEDKQILIDRLEVKEKEMERMQKLLDQQQQLTLQSNKQIETLQQQLLLSNQSDEKEEETSDTIETPEEQSETLEETVHEEIKSESKKWWQLWK